MTTLFNIWKKDGSGPFTRLYTSLTCCDAEMVAVCLGIEQDVFTAYASNEQQTLLGPQLSIKHVAVTKNIYLFDVPAIPIEEQVTFQQVPPIRTGNSVVKSRTQHPFSTKKGQTQGGLLTLLTPVRYPTLSIFTH